MIAVKEFTTGAEVIANAVAVRARLWKVRRRAPEKVAVETSSVFSDSVIIDPPMWRKIPMLFDEHVTAYRADKLIRAMVASGEIEFVSPGKKSVPSIVKEVLEKYPQFTIADLKGERGPRELTLVRQIACYEVRRQRPDLSFPSIGRWFGGRDHTTIMHSVAKIAAMRGEA